jgi:hypothetical protein
MRTVVEIEVTPGADLWVDVLMDPPGLAIRRRGAGLVRVEPGEVSDLIQVLSLAGMELQALVSDEVGKDE